jgi:predicted NBD/HSP70 family sugar kinase
VPSGHARATRLRSEGLPTRNARDVAAEVKKGNTAAIVAVRQAGRELGQVLAGLVNSLNPHAIILGGALSAASDPLLAGVREAVYRRSPSLATRNLQIYVSSARERAGVVGAASMTVDRILSSTGTLSPQTESHPVRCGWPEASSSARWRAGRPRRSATCVRQENPSASTTAP